MSGCADRRRGWLGSRVRSRLGQAGHHPVASENSGWGALSAGSRELVSAASRCLARRPELPQQLSGARGIQIGLCLDRAAQLLWRHSKGPKSDGCWYKCWYLEIFLIEVPPLQVMISLPASNMPFKYYAANHGAWVTISVVRSMRLSSRSRMILRSPAICRAGRDHRLGSKCCASRARQSSSKRNPPQCHAECRKTQGALHRS